LNRGEFKKKDQILGSVGNTSPTVDKKKSEKGTSRKQVGWQWKSLTSGAGELAKRSHGAGREGALVRGKDGGKQSHFQEASSVILG